MSETAFRGLVVFLLMFFGMAIMGSTATTNSRLSSMAYDLRKVERLVEEAAR